MTFGRRLRTYLVGFGMGLIMVYFTFGERMCASSPGNRVKLRLHALPIFKEAKASCLLECYSLNDSIVKQVFINGEVIWGESAPRTSPNPIYMLESKDKSFKIKCEAKDSTQARILDFIPAVGKECDC